MILRGFAIYWTHAEESLDETYQYIKERPLVGLTLHASVSKRPFRLIFIFRLSYNTAYHFHVSYISIAKIYTTVYTPHRSTLGASESTPSCYLILIQHPPGAIIARMVLWQDTVPLLITNNCADTIWPGIYTTAGTGPGTGGFELAAGANRSLEVGSDWYGRIWGRTNCTSPSEGVLTCTTGSCGQMDCTQAAVSRSLIVDVYVTIN